MRFFTCLMVFLLLAGAACADRPVRSLLEARQENLIMQRWDNSCGAAALATMLTYYRGFPVSEQQVAHGMLRQGDPLQVKHRGGFSLLDMKRYAAQIGFESDGYADMSMDDLALLAPVIVPLKVRGYHHFVIVRGLLDQDQGQDIDIADPGFGNYRMKRSVFTRAWAGIAFQIERLQGK